MSTDIRAIQEKLMAKAGNAARSLSPLNTKTSVYFPSYEDMSIDQLKELERQATDWLAINRKHAGYREASMRHDRICLILSRKCYEAGREKKTLVGSYSGQ